MKALCKIFSKEIQDIEKNGVIVEGKRYDFNFFFTSDLKFLWIVTFPYNNEYGELIFNKNTHASGFGDEAWWNILLPLLLGFFSKHIPLLCDLGDNARNS